MECRQISSNDHSPKGNNLPGFLKSKEMPTSNLHSFFFLNESIHITLSMTVSAFHHSTLCENSPFFGLLTVCLSSVQKWTSWKGYKKIKKSVFLKFPIASNKENKLWKR